MWDLSFSHDEAVGSLVRQLQEFVTTAGSCDDLTLLEPSRCRGWSRLDVVVHVQMGLHEMAIGTGDATPDHPDHDAASYWTSHPDDRDDDPVPHILWLRRVASAYQRPSAAVTHLRDVASTATRVVHQMPDTVITFQGNRMRSGDFLATWVVELAVHQLDLDVEGEAPSGLAWTRRTLEALAGAVLPYDLDDASAVLLGLGRVPCSTAQQLPTSFPVSL